MKKRWTTTELTELRRRYPDETTEAIGNDLGRTASSVYQAANKLGLKKSKEFMREQHGTRLKTMESALANRFKKGQAAWNKGMKGLDIGGKETRFKPGHIPKTHRPVGSTREQRDGYVYIKTAEPDVWEPLHHVVWQVEHGAVPDGFTLRFKDGNRQNCEIGNLELVSRKEGMKRNTLHNYPPELVSTILMLGALNRKLNNA